MKRLMLLRHAKSSWAEPAQADRDRPLSERGQRDAAAMAASIADHAPLPDRVLCSSAKRTRETLAAFLPHLDEACEIEVMDDIYDAGGPDYGAIIREAGAEAATLMLIGHNPTMHATAITYCGGDGRDLLAPKYPTGSLTVLDLPDRPWSDLRPASGRLEAFVRPRDLPGRDGP